MFGASLNKLLIGAAISSGAKYVKDEYFQGSFLDQGLKTIGSTCGVDKFFGSDPVSKGAYEIAKGAGATVVEQLLSQGLGVDPSTGKNMPSINVPEQDVFRSNVIQRAKNYGGFPQGSRRVLENAFQDSAIQDMAMRYTQSKMANMRVIEPTVRLSGLGALGKGQIKSTKI
jgi:hypothetical protein